MRRAGERVGIVSTAKFVVDVRFSILNQDRLIQFFSLPFFSFFSANYKRV